MVNTKFNHAVG